MRFIVLIVIITAAVAAGLGLLWVLNNQPPAPPPVAIQAQQGMQAPVPTVDVFVARADIPVGTTLTEAMIDKQPWPKHLVLDGFITAGSPGAAEVTGMVARGDFKAREPLIKTKLAHVEEPGFLAASLGNGMRAVTLGVDSVSGVAGFVFPGDRVDILLTHGLTGSQSPAGVSHGATASEVLLANVKVLAVNARKNTLNEPQNRAPGEVMTPGNVTLEISQDDSKKLRLAEKNGTLSLALRSMQDMNDSSSGPPVTVRDLSTIKEKEEKKQSVAAGPKEDVLIVRGLQ